MAEDNNTFLNADYIYEDVEGEAGKSLNLIEDQKNNLVGLIQSRFAVAEESRDADERRWLEAYENYRGLYGKRVKFRESEKSRIFIKITKTKVLAAFGQLVDVLFGTGKFPIGISETKIPEGEKANAYLDFQNPQPGIETSQPVEDILDNIGNLKGGPFDIGYRGDGKVLKPGATFGDGMFEDSEQSLEDKAEELGVLREGTTPDPQKPELSPAQRAARRMEKLIHDQIEESNGSSEIRSALLEAALLGTGIIKGPFNYNKTLNNWKVNDEGEREYSPIQVRVPRIEFVSCWDFYPDPGGTNIDECEYVIHRHRMNTSQLRALRNMPYFDKDAIREAIQEGPNYLEKDFESQLKDDYDTEEAYSNAFEVVEYWGIMDAQYAREVGIELDEDIDDLDEVQINAWICGNKLLRAVVNPFTPYRIPYHAFPYEKNPYNFFGIGVAENMMMFDRFRQLADEQTGIPSYSHGQTGVQSMTRTASGMSMLLGAASLNIKTVVKNLDDFLLKPLGEAYFQWNMQFFEGDLDVKGDLEVKATGTNSLMQKEVRSQRLTMFLQTAQSPAIAPFVKISKLISELAYSLDLDPDEILNDPEEAAMMAQIIGMQNVRQETGEEAQPVGEQQGAMGGIQGAPEQSAELGPTGTGGGNIGIGNVPVAGETTFSGTIGAAGAAGQGSPE